MLSHACLAAASAGRGRVSSHSAWRCESQETSALMPCAAARHAALVRVKRRPCATDAPAGPNRRDGRELEAGGGPRRHRRLVGVDDRVGEPADAGDDRHAAIAQPVELGQPARLEARGDEMRVGRRPASGATAPRHSRSTTPTRPGWPPQPRGSAPPARLRRSRAPRAARRCAPVVGSTSSRRSMPFCQVRRLTTPKSRRVVGARGRSAARAPACWRRGRDRLRIVGRGRCGSVAGSQTSVSMPLTMPDSTSARAREQPVEAHAGLGRADLLRHRSGDTVVMRSASCRPAFRKPIAAVIFDAVEREGSGGSPSCRSAAGNWPWKARLWTVITVAGPRPAGVMRDRPARAPPASHGHGRHRAEAATSPGRSRRRPAQRGEAPRSCRANPGRRGQIGIARAIEEVRGIEHDDVEPAGLARDQPRRPPKGARSA